MMPLLLSASMWPAVENDSPNRYMDTKGTLNAIILPIAVLASKPGFNIPLNMILNKDL
jgi:hypothetical protein